MHPTNKESMLLTVQQEDPDSSDNDSVNSSDVSEDELDMLLATMGTTSLKDSEMAILQNDASSEEPVEEITSVEEVDTPEELIAPIEASVPPVEDNAPIEPASPEEILHTEEPKPSPRMTARRVVQNFFRKLRGVK